MKQKNESILDMLIVFFPLLPGFLWLLFGTAVVEVIFDTGLGKIYLFLDTLSFPVFYPLYCVLFCKRDMGDRPIYPAMFYFLMDVIPTLVYISFIVEGLKMLTGWKGEVITWVFRFIGAGILLAAMWLVSECIFRWMSKRKNPL